MLLSLSLVVYKPDLKILEDVVSAIQIATVCAKKRYSITLDFTIVDNSSDDAWGRNIQLWLTEHVEKWPDLNLHKLDALCNMGYGRGNNLVIDQIVSDYHVVINPDLFIAHDSLLNAIEFLQSNTDVGLLTPSVNGIDGTRHYLCKRNPSLFILFLRGFAPFWLKSFFQTKLDFFEMRDCNYESIIDNIEFPTGCFMFFRTSFLKQLHGFDSSFFMYMEDADIGRRMLKIARVVYVPSVKVVHKWARGTHTNWRLRLETIRSAIIYWKKWGGVF